MSESRAPYEHDLVRWSEEQADAIRAASTSGTNLPLDWDHIADEIEDLGRSLRGELRNRLATIIEHLLRLELSDAVEPRRGSIETIQRERLEVEALLDENPSLRATLAEQIASVDAKARKLAEIGFQRFGEWSPERRGSLAELRFPETDILGPWLAERRS